MSRSSDGIEPVILTRRAFVILQLFSSRACPRWSLMRSTRPARCAVTCPHDHTRRGVPALRGYITAGARLACAAAVRPAGGRAEPDARAARPAPGLPERSVSAAHVPPAGSRVGAALRPAHAAPDNRGRAVGDHAGRSGQRRRAGRSRDADLALDGVAGADGTADPADADAEGAQRRRCRAPARPPLRDHADRRRHPPPDRCAARPQGRHPQHLAARASRRRGRMPRSGNQARYPAGCAGRSAEEPGTRSPCTPCWRRAWVASTSQPDRPLPERTGTGTRAWRSRRTTSARTATDGSRSSASRSGTGAAWQPRWASRS